MNHFLLVQHIMFFHITFILVIYNSESYLAFGGLGY